MKKLLIAVIFGILFLGWPRSFCGEGPGRMVLPNIFAAQLRTENNLTEDQQEEVRRMLEAETNRDGELPENVARDVFADWQQAQLAGGQAEEKGGGEIEGQAASGASVIPVKRDLKKGWQGAVEQLARQKKVPKALENAMSGFFPANYAMPLAWNIQFPKGAMHQAYTRIPLGESGYLQIFNNLGTINPLSDYKRLAISPDGHYVALFLDKLYVLNMQENTRKTIEIGHYDCRLALAAGGRLGYRDMLGNDRIGVIDIVTGKTLWTSSAPIGSAPAFSADNKYFIDIKQGNHWSISDEKPYPVRNSDTGERVEVESLLWSGPILPSLAYSFDGTKKATLDKKTLLKTLLLQNKIGEEWHSYYKLPLERRPNRIHISPYGMRWSAVYLISDPEDPSYRVSIHIVDVKSNSNLLILLKNFIDGGFSPDGHHFILATFDLETNEVVVKVADLYQFFEGVEEYEGAEQYIRKGESKLRDENAAKPE